MSAKIGTIEINNGQKLGDVWCSRGGVEVYIYDFNGSMTAIDARNIAALFTRAAEEHERMREKPPTLEDP